MRIAPVAISEVFHPASGTSQTSGPTSQATSIGVVPGFLSSIAIGDLSLSSEDPAKRGRE